MDVPAACAQPTADDAGSCPVQKAVPSWSLFRTLGRYVARGAMPSGALRENTGDGGLPLLELPRQLAEHGYRSVQLCHFYLPTRDPAYLDELRTAFDENEVGFLVDLGNWPAPGKYAELAAVAGRAETCQAKCRTDQQGELDLEDYRASLTVLRDGGYDGPLALVYDGPDPEEWAKLEDEFSVVQRVFT